MRKSKPEPAAIEGKTLSKKQRQRGDAPVAVETVIDYEIDLMLRRLQRKGVCPGCTAQGLLWRGGFLHTDFAGAEKTAALCLEIADSIKQPDDAEMSDTQH